jgi:hypothetical protein
MIVRRDIWTVKEGCLDDAVAQIKFYWDRFPHGRAVRIWVPHNDAASNVLISDHEFESLGDYERFASAVVSDPGFDTLVRKRLSELLDDSRHEMWELVAELE